MKPKLFVYALFVLFLSCNKSEILSDQDVENRKLVFSSKKEAFDQVRHYLHENYPNETLYSIENISYIHNRSKTMAIVFYQTNTGTHNMLVERSYTNEESLGNRVTVCEGTECQCKVTAIIDNQGNVTVDCNCGSCAMISTEM